MNNEEASKLVYGLLTNSMMAQDANRDRSKQVEIGPSELGVCRRKVYYRITQAPKLNETEKLAPILGTWIHAGIAEAIKRSDPFGDQFLIEQEFSADGIPMHTDLYIKDKKMVVDWKTTTRKSMRYFPSESQVWQVQTYANILIKNGYEVDKVVLCTIPRDGKMSEILVHAEDYDVAKAEAALAWKKEVEQYVINEEVPLPEKPKYWCSSYCEYYDPTGERGCPSTSRA